MKEHSKYPILSYPLAERATDIGALHYGTESDSKSYENFKEIYKIMFKNIWGNQQM